VDLPTRFELAGLNGTRSSHRLGAVVYGSDKDGYVTRVVEADGTIMEWSVEKGRSAVQSAEGGGDSARWDLLDVAERFAVGGRRALAAFYVMEYVE
jgi:hypothetical protein